MEDTLALRPDFFMLTAYDQAEEYFLAKGWVEKIKDLFPSARIITGGLPLKAGRLLISGTLKPIMP